MERVCYLVDKYEARVHFLSLMLHEWSSIFDTVNEAF